MRSVCVFCASSPAVPECYHADARALGALLAEAGWRIVYGGGSTGLMGDVADAAMSRGGEVTGVIPTFMVEVEWQHPDVADMRQTVTMWERKRLMMDLADAIVVLPGSTGTMDEFFEAMADKKLGLHTKPLVLLNTNGFFDHTVAQVERMVAERFMTRRHADVLKVAQTPTEVLELIGAGPEEAIGLRDAAVKE